MASFITDTLLGPGALVQDVLHVAYDKCLSRFALFIHASSLRNSSQSEGGAIMIMSLALFENEFLNIVSISFTSLVLNELIMVALEITTWYVSLSSSSSPNTPDTGGCRHVYMIISEVVTFFLYAVSLVFLPEYFGTPVVHNLGSR